MKLKSQCNTTTLNRGQNNYFIDFFKTWLRAHGFHQVTWQRYSESPSNIFPATTVMFGSVKEFNAMEKWNSSSRQKSKGDQGANTDYLSNKIWERVENCEGNQNCYFCWNSQMSIRRYSRRYFGRFGFWKAGLYNPCRSLVRTILHTSWRSYLEQSSTELVD